MTVKLWGIDVSSHQGYIDWSKVKKAGVKFVIIRGGYGNSTVDKRFKENIEGAIKNDIDIGIYWFSYAINASKARTEAQLCLKTIEPYKDKINYPVFYDLEYDTVRYAKTKGVTIGKNLASSMAKAFLEEIRSKGYKIGLYTNLDYARNYFSYEVLNKYDIWIANYSTRCNYWGKYTMWQYSERGRVDGIYGNSVDKNYSYKDYSKYSNNQTITNHKQEETLKVDTNVRQLQVALNLCYNAELKLDGLYGPLTKAAVKKNILKKGIENDYVLWLQEKLKELNYNIVIDGYFGPKTEGIVKEYQDDKNLKVDGIVGIITITSILESL